jgi:hypothetical protein
MNKEQIENKIKELKEEIAKDERMQIEEPNSMYWWDDYSFNSSLLWKYEEKLKKFEVGEN